MWTALVKNPFIYAYPSLLENATKKISIVYRISAHFLLYSTSRLLITLFCALRLAAKCCFFTAMVFNQSITQSIVSDGR